MIGLGGFARVLAIVGLVGASGGCGLFTTQYGDDSEGELDSGTGETTDGDPPAADESTGAEEPPPAGCASKSAPTVGENEIAGLRHNWGVLQCIFGCGAQQPLAAHAVSELLVLDSEQLGEFTVASDNTDVATFSSQGGAVVSVETGQAGSVRLELRDPASNELLEAFVLEVADVAEIDASQGWTSQLMIMVGGAVRIPVEVRDEFGCSLVGFGAVDYEIGEGFDEYSLSLYDIFSDLLVELLFGGNLEETFEIEALEQASGTVLITAPAGASFELPVAAVGEEAVASIESPGQIDLALGSTVIFGVDAHAADGERVYSPDCEWTVEPAGTAALVDLRHEVAVTPSGAGTVVVTCSVGGAESSTSVVVD